VLSQTVDGAPSEPHAHQIRQLDYVLVGRSTFRVSRAAFLGGTLLALNDRNPFNRGKTRKADRMAPALMSFAVLFAGMVAVLLVFSHYNALVRAQKRTQEAWSGIDVQLRRRASLVPNVVETVRGYAEHERETLEEVARARGALQKADGAGATGAASNMLTQALGRLMAVVESYPQLRASDSFTSLRDDLRDTEEKIAFARQFYNRNVLDYNTRIETYPDVILARNFGFTAAEFFETDGGGRAEVHVSFDRSTSGPQQPASPPAA
jgi:LemA protein